MMSRTGSSKFTAVKIIVVAGVLLVVASLYAWWRLVYSNPTHVFERMLATSLATPSVTKTVDQIDESQKLKQVAALVTEPEQIVRSVSTLEQVDSSDTRVITESIGTPTSDYIRYADIQTNQKNAQGQEYDFSSVLGTWGKTTEQNSGSGSVQLFNQTVLGVVPVASVRQPLRAQLLEEINRDGVYKFNSEAVKRSTRNGRPTYTYRVEIKPAAYIKMLKSFASAIGMTQLEQVDPAQYENSPMLEFDFEIDVWSSQLVKITYTNTTRTETSSGFGARMQIEEPNSSIGAEELQMRLQQLQ